MEPLAVFRHIRKLNEFQFTALLFLTILMTGVSFIQGWHFSLYVSGFLLGKTISSYHQLRRTIHLSKMIESGEATVKVSQIEED